VANSVLFWLMARRPREHPSPEIDGPLLRRMRKIAGMSASELARRVEVAPTYMAAIERGDRPTISPALYARICDAMGIVDRTELLRKVAGGQR
jgi:transcriptional regulator with XRE-family HTH domain